MKNKEILVDYLNIYTIIYVVLFRYTKVSLLYKHKYLNNLYAVLLKFCNIKISYLEIKYSSSNYKSYQKIAIEKDYLTEHNLVEKNLLHNYIYKKYFYERVHPIVELKVFFGHLKFDRILINYGDYFYLLHKDSFYKKIRYYSLPLFAKFNNGNYAFNYVYTKKAFFFIRSYLISVYKILRFSFSQSTSLNAKLLVATQFKQSFVSDSLYSIDKSDIDYILIDPATSTLYSKDGDKISHLYNLNIRDIIKSIKGIYDAYSEFAITYPRNLSLNLHIIEKSKDIFFLRQIINKSGIKVIYTCYEGSPIINILNLLGYKSNDVVSACSMWSLGYKPEFLNELYKGADIFFSWGEKHNINYLDCKSPFRSLVKVGYLGDYAIDYMKNKSEHDIERLINSGNKVIAVYDNVAFLDYLITYSQLNNFFQGVLDALEEGSYACVIKTKFSAMHKNVDKKLVDRILKYSHKVVVMDEKSDLSPAFKSDFVYAFHQSSLGNIASIWGKKTIFYDESSFIDNRMISKNSIIISSSDEFIPAMKALENFSPKIDKNSFIDPFVDSKAQDRITEYIQSLLCSKDTFKSSIIKDSNILYKLQHGDDKVLEKEG